MVDFNAVVATATATGITPVITGGAVLDSVAATSTFTGISPALTGGASFFALPATSTRSSTSPAFLAGAALAAIPATSTFTAISNILTDSWFSAATAQAQAQAIVPGSTDGTAGFYPANYGELP